MRMNKPNKNKMIWLFLVFLLTPLIGHAAIYKWVDANGVTHYSQKKPAKNNTKKLKVAPKPASVKTSEELFQEKEKARREKIEKENAKIPKTKKPTKRRRPKSVSKGVEDGSDSSRCALAKDILNGSLVHAGGRPMDAYDIRTAKNDVKKFCR